MLYTVKKQSSGPSVWVSSVSLTRMNPTSLHHSRNLPRHWPGLIASEHSKMTELTQTLRILWSDVHS
jgi:hypothetical protein